MNTIEQEWQELASRIFSPTTPPIQRKEMRRAFYAGAVAIFNMISTAVDDDTDDDSFIAGMQQWEEEFRQFAEAVQAGKA